MASGVKELLGVFLLVIVLLESFQAAPVNNGNYRRAARQAVKRDVTDGFLPRTVTPTHYELEITPDIYSSSEPPFSFSGAVRIYVNCTGNTDIIVINSNKLDIIGVDVRSDPANVVQPPSPILLQWTLDPEPNFLTMIVANPLEYGYLYVIYVYFIGTMVNDDIGLNYNSYADIDGSTKYVVFSALQDLGARRLFPCLDEPDLKATYNITILSQPPMKTLSNMPEISSEVRGSYIAHTFATTPKMSTYQVAVIVGDFVAIPVEWQNYTTYPITLYGRPEVSRQLAFAASIVAPIQKWLEDATGVPYPLPKMDHIALPGVETWELENWGAIAYGETFFSINSQYSGATGRLRVARTIAHELAHQWFGNLVTFKTYEDVWLREGFAQHFGYRALDAIGWPGREMQQADEVEGTLDFLNFDSLNTSDPVRKPVPTVWDSEAASEGSTYQKGGAIVRQLQGILTTSTFKNAITNFLTKYAYDSATTEDLWDVLNAQAASDGRPVDVRVTNAWLNQWGYPVVFVYSNTNGTATAMPRQYFSPSGQSATTPSPYNYQWDIPVTILTKATTEFDGGVAQWIPSGVSSFHLTDIPTAPQDWFLLNTNQNFFYRIDYDLTNRANIVNQFLTDHTVIPTETRCQHIDDTFQLSETLNALSTTAMDLTQYLASETEYSPWHFSLKHLRIFDRLLQGFLWYSNYKIYMSSLVLPTYNRLGWVYDDNENPFEQFLRRDILINACYYGLSDCLDRARAEYTAYKADTEASTVDANNLPTVLCAGVAAGDGTDWSFVLQQYQNNKQSATIEDRFAYLFAMACSSDTFWLERYLSYITQGTIIDVRDQNAAIFFLSQNRVGLPIARDYFYNSWSTVPNTISKLDRLLEISYTFTTFADSNQFNNFVGLHPPATSYEKDKFLQMDRVILQNIDWIESNEYELQNWLDNHIPTQPPVAKLSKLQLPISPMVHWYSLRKFN